MEPVVILGPTTKHLWCNPNDSISGDWSKNYLEPIKTIKVDCEPFPSGESYCQIQDNIRGRDVYIMQSVCAPANDSLMDLLVMCDAARRASAGRLTAVIPFLGYMRQDRKDKPRVPISAKLVIDMLECAGVERIITMDVHTLQAQGFTNIPFDHLFSYPLFAAQFKALQQRRNTFAQGAPIVFAAPDIGAIKRASAYAEAFGANFAVVNKKRMGPDTKPISLVGDVEGAEVIIVDDLTETVGTIVGAAQICRDNGAKGVRAAVTHACLTEAGLKTLDAALNSGLITEFITTDTVHAPRLKDMAGNVTVLRSVEWFVRAIGCTNRNESITDLFQIKGY